MRGGSTNHKVRSLVFDKINKTGNLFARWIKGENKAQMTNITSGKGYSL